MARPHLQLDYLWISGTQVRRLNDFEFRKLIELMFLMNDGDEIGVLSTGGVAWSSDEAARAIGLSDAEGVRLVDRLTLLDVIQRDGAGRIVCGRMVADERRREQLRKNGSLGGRPHKKTKLVNQEVNQPPNQTVTQKGNQSDVYVYVSDSRGISNSEWGVGGSPPVRGKSAEALASEVYEAYPRKEGRKAAIAAILKAAREIGGPDPFAKLLGRTRRYAVGCSKAKREPGFIPHAATWFNQGRYDDDEAEWDRPRPVGGFQEPKPEPTPDWVMESLGIKRNAS